MPPLAEEIFEKYPFLSLVTYGGQEYVGIVQNQDDTVLSMYDYSRLPVELKETFLALGDTWWWESNRQLPIDIFLHYEMKQFHKCLRTFVMKDIEVLFGPMTSLQNLLRKRIKRRGVQLVIKPKD